MKTNKVDPILSPEEVHGSKNASYEKQLTVVLLFLIVLGVVALAVVS